MKHEHKHSFALRACVTAALAAAAMAPGFAAAQSPMAGPWRYSGSLYLYGPSVSGTARYPQDGTSFERGDIMDSLDMAFMGSLEANNGRWGAFTDYMYVSFDNSKSGSRSMTIGNAALPVNVSADIGMNLKAAVWTLAGEYRLAGTPQATVDLIAGARMLKTKQKVNWTLNGQVGSIAPGVRSAAREGSETVWDGIIGVKGRYGVSADNKWAVPYYLDVGAGGSASTFQAAAGISYAFGWGEVVGMWRYLTYNAKDGKNLSDLTLNGPMVGARWSW
jgi:hypothetical protein